jgi:starvation-inducible DNA-binding protein
MTNDTLHPTLNDLPSDARNKVVALLNQQLIDTLDLHSQVKVAHWNVKGPNFIAIHEMFDDFADTLAEASDEIAERSTALGGTAPGTAKQVAVGSRLPAYPTLIKSVDHLKALADRYAHLAKTTRAAIDEAGKLGDADTADLFTGFSRDLDKALWFIEAHLQG